MKRLLILSIIALYALFSWAQQGSVCDVILTSGRTSLLMTWETTHYGDVVITIADGAGCKGTCFRGSNGMGNALTAFQVRVPKQGGYDTYPAANYFTKDYREGGTTLTLCRKDGVMLPAGAQIYFTGGAVEWLSEQNTNAYVLNQTFLYTYGASCGTLSQPQVESFSENGVLTYSSVIGADYYMVHVYRGRELFFEDTILSGNAIPFHSYLDATYDVTVSAHTEAGNYSKESDAVSWTLTADLAYLPASSLCAEPFGKDPNSMAALTWETTTEGDVVITISGEAGTTFRSQGMGSDLADFSVEGVPASTWFDRVYEGSGAITYTLHLRDANVHPTYGSKIRYHGDAHSLEYITPLNGNAYSQFDFEYIYGTVCPRLEQPTIANISADGVLTLEHPVAYAGQYELLLYRGELLVYATFLQDGEAFAYVPTVSYPYTIYVRAIADGMVPSELSEPYIWMQSGVEMDMPLSTMCESLVSTNDGGVTLTVTTADNGDIRFVLGGNAHPVWRGEGLKTSVMQISGFPIEDYFTQLPGYVGDTLMILRPKLSSQGIFFPGDQITYNNHVEWYYAYQSSGTGTSRWVLDYMFTYLYGTTCDVLPDRLPAPVITDITSHDILTFSSVSGAAYYEARILDADGDEVLRVRVEDGDSLPRALTIMSGFEYCVELRAMPAVGATVRESVWSICFPWTPAEIESSEPIVPVTPTDTTVVVPQPPTPEFPDQPSQDDHFFPDPPVVPTITDSLADLTDTIPDTPQDLFLPETSLPTDSPRKVMENGQVYIYVDERKYNLLGQLVQ